MKKYINQSVLQASIERISISFDIFENSIEFAFKMIQSLSFEADL